MRWTVKFWLWWNDLWIKMTNQTKDPFWYVKQMKYDKRRIKLRIVWIFRTIFCGFIRAREWHDLYCFDHYRIKGDVLAPGVIKKQPPLFPKLK